MAERVVKTDRDDWLREFEVGLAIDEHALDEACRDQPELYYRVAKKLAIEMSRRDAAKQELAETEAEVDQKLRRDAELTDEKITEKAIQAQLALHKDVRQANQVLLDLNRRVGLLQAIRDGFSQRGYVLRDLVQMHLSAYYGDVSASSQDRQIKDRRVATVKEVSNRMRRS